MTSKAEAFITGTHHRLEKMQKYLNEFCYHFGHRKFAVELFNRLLSACISAKTIPCAKLT